MTVRAFDGNGGITTQAIAVTVTNVIEPPLFTVIRTNTNTVLISWPESAIGFRLENNSNLSDTNGWATAPQARSTNGGQISVAVSATNGDNFYRLKNPSLWHLSLADVFNNNRSNYAPKSAEQTNSLAP